MTETQVRIYYGQTIKMMCSPLHSFFGIISFTSSSDEQKKVECTIEKYWEDDTFEGEFPPYKLKVVPKDERYATETFYYSDFIGNINSGSISL